MGDDVVQLARDAGALVDDRGLGGVALVSHERLAESAALDDVAGEPWCAEEQREEDDAAEADAVRIGEEHHDPEEGRHRARGPGPSAGRVRATVVDDEQHDEAERLDIEHTLWQPLAHHTDGQEDEHQREGHPNAKC